MHNVRDAIDPGIKIKNPKLGTGYIRLCNFVSERVFHLVDDKITAGSVMARSFYRVCLGKGVQYLYKA